MKLTTGAQRYTPQRLARSFVLRLTLHVTDTSPRDSISHPSLLHCPYKISSKASMRESFAFDVTYSTFCLTKTFRRVRLLFRSWVGTLAKTLVNNSFESTCFVQLWRDRRPKRHFKKKNPPYAKTNVTGRWEELLCECFLFKPFLARVSNTLGRWVWKCRKLFNYLTFPQCIEDYSLIFGMVKERWFVCCLVLLGVWVAGNVWRPEGEGGKGGAWV